MTHERIFFYLNLRTHLYEAEGQREEEEEVEVEEKNYIGSNYSILS